MARSLKEPKFKEILIVIAEMKINKYSAKTGRKASLNFKAYNTVGVPPSRLGTLKLGEAYGSKPLGPIQNSKGLWQP
jgi:hypothetical protein